jgi:hypothetical protein
MAPKDPSLVHLFDDDGDDGHDADVDLDWNLSLAAPTLQDTAQQGNPLYNPMEHGAAPYSLGPRLVQAKGPCRAVGS